MHDEPPIADALGVPSASPPSALAVGMLRGMPKKKRIRSRIGLTHRLLGDGGELAVGQVA